LRGHRLDRYRRPGPGSGQPELDALGLRRVTDAGIRAALRVGDERDRLTCLGAGHRELRDDEPAVDRDLAEELVAVRLARRERSGPGRDRRRLDLEPQLVA